MLAWKKWLRSSYYFEVSSPAHTPAAPAPGSTATGIPANERATCAVLIEFIHRLMAATNSNAAGFLSDSELTLSQLKVLFTLGGNDGPMPVNEIADRIHLSLAATGRTVDKLVGAALVDRREDETDRRVKRISLTRSGREFIAAERAVKDDTVASFVSILPPDVAQQLRAALDRIVHAGTDYFAECHRTPRTAAHPA